MSEIQRILFSPHLYIREGLHLLRLEDVRPNSAVLKYSRDGQEVARGLRIRMFSGPLRSTLRVHIIDKTERPGEDQALKAAERGLAIILGKTFSKNVPTRSQKTSR